MVTAIVLAAGKGTRVGGEIPKQYMEVAGNPLLYYCLDSFEKSSVSDVVIVADPSMAETCDEIVSRYGFGKVSVVISGGSERYFSVLNALRALSIRPESPDYVLIHDGARPYITPAGINTLIDEVSRFGAVVAAAPANDTIKITDQEGFVLSTTDRSVTWQVQTPQCFLFNDIFEAYEKVVAPLEGSRDISITDDSMVFEQAFPGRKVKLLDLGAENGKITTAQDLKFMKFLLG